MTAYDILTQTVTDMARYRDEYGAKTPYLLEKYAGDLVVATPTAEPFQGDPPEGVVIVRFPSEEAVRAFVSDPEYQPLKKVRLELTANASAVLAPALEMPPASCAMACAPPR